MKIGVMSDSHDNLPLIRRAVERFNEERVELVLHAGDFISAFTAGILSGLDSRLVGVFGNNDGEKIFLKKRFQSFGELHEDYAELELAGKKIVIMHQPKFLDILAASDAYDLIIYGHTHQIDIRPGPPMVLNPGECGGWLTNQPTVAVVDLATMTPTILALE